MVIYKVKKRFILVPFVAFSVFKSSKRGSKSTLIVPKESYDWNEVITQNRNEVITNVASRVLLHIRNDVIT